MKPMIVLPPGVMSKEDIQKLEGNGICVVEVENPALVKFLDPLWTVADRPLIEQAAIELSRRLLNERYNTQDMKVGKWEISRMFVECLLKGTPLQQGPTKAELEAEQFQQLKYDEMRRLAREEAKADRAAEKAAAAEKTKSKKGT